MGRKKSSLDPSLVVELFDRGLDTRDIASRLLATEAEVYHALQSAREARRRPVDPDSATAASEHKPPLENQ